MLSVCSNKAREHVDKYQKHSHQSTTSDSLPCLSDINVNMDAAGDEIHNGDAFNELNNHVNCQLPFDDMDINNHEEHKDPPPLPKMEHFLHTSEQKCLVQLMILLDDIGALDYAYGEILKWARNASQTGFDFNPSHGLSCLSTLKWMYKTCKESKIQLPQIVPTTLKSREVSEASYMMLPPQSYPYCRTPI